MRTAGLPLLLVVSACVSLPSPGPSDSWTGARHAHYPIKPLQTSVHVVEMGPKDGEAVIMVHGLGGSAEDFRGLAASLASQRRVRVIDFPGSGRSSEVRRAMGPGDKARIIHEVVRDWPRFSVVAHSMGAAPAIEYAARFPERVSRLVLLNPVGGLHGSAMAEAAVATDDDDIPTQLGALFLANRIARMSRMSPERVFRLATSAANTRQKSAVALAMWDLGPALSRVRAPTQVVWGSPDAVVSRRAALMIASRIRSARLDIIDDAGHNPMAAAPERTARLVRGFLEGEIDVVRQARKVGLEDIIIRGQRGRLSGSYGTVVIDRSALDLHEVTAERLVIRDSMVNAVDLLLDSPDVALFVERSSLRATGGAIRGFVGVSAAHSRMDLAGVRIVAQASAVRAEGTTSIIASSSSVRHARGEERLHRVVRLKAGTEL